MVIARANGHRRWGAAAVETALVMLLVTMFFFAVFEYGRLLMDWNILDSAAREGCRYAQVNNTATTINTDVTNVVTAAMAGRNTSFTNLTVSVSGTHQGVTTSVNNLVAGDMITVSVSGKYKLMNIIPLISMPAAITVTSAVTMGCEGAT